MTQAQPQRTTSDLVKAAVSGWLGTALEFMDFQLYSLGAALVFHEIFFPEQSAAMGSPDSGKTTSSVYFPPLLWHGVSAKKTSSKIMWTGWRT